MKRSSPFKTLSLLSISLSCLAGSALAADYSPYPKAGVYDASDSGFERLLTVKPDGKFTLEVAEKGKPGNLRSGAGEGKLSDAPGGWNFSEGRCNMTLKRAAGGMQLHVEACASSWGDVPFDGKYKYQGEEVAAAPAKPIPAAAPMPVAKTTVPATPAAPAPTVAVTQAAPPPTANGLPSRKEIDEKWQAISVNRIGNKDILFVAKPIENKSSTPNPIEQFSKAVFVIDTSTQYREMSATEKAKSPLQLVEITLPETGPKEGLDFLTDCIYGKSDKVIVINKTGGSKLKRMSAWMLDNNLKAVEIKQVSKVNCKSPFY
ncbi:hypothetical protein [Undibacterium pigrum]|uniref:Uncharacterized protein n=1 Tax=Undibacterium pigrum TaxID=401470 RepID=A0A318J2U6_9BURK|nr:hypothetical protein [Undibacterium pigrum]PXX41956.1 hypothetical protein DFR42_106135 [Undibacterium pigrum]